MLVFHTMRAAELTTIITSPSIDITALCQCKAMPLAYGNGNNFGREAGELNWFHTKRDRHHQLVVISETASVNIAICCDKQR
jgi:hypothetical protein